MEGQVVKGGVGSFKEQPRRKKKRDKESKLLTIFIYLPKGEKVVFTTRPSSHKGEKVSL